MRENHADPTQPPYNPLQTSLPDMDVTPLPAVYFDREVEKAQSNSTLVSGTASAPQTPSAPLTPRERKLLQARGQHPPTVPSRVPYTASRSATSLPFATSAGQIDNNYNPDVQPDIIIQHRDGGAGIVQELPPPYADRSALGSASLSSPSASSLSNPSRFREHTD
ncbi:hypothetical protein BC629DRAFT_1180670 [Irpex lacteus]|nr:hypothetical protein BC629DRAFT_1180670 [Irpex lacteus]